MEYLGLWKLKRMLALSKGSFRTIEESELSTLEENDYTKRVKMMFRAGFIISESTLSICFKPVADEPVLPQDEGKPITKTVSCLSRSP